MLRTPYLIQRASVKNVEITSALKTGDYLNLDYMGSSEFEFGAIPKCQREMNAKLSELQIHSVTEGSTTLFFMAKEKEVKEYSAMLVELIKGTIRTKERVGLTETDIVYEMKGKKRVANFNHPKAPFKYSVWIDLTNNLIFARNKEVLEQLKITIPNSVKFMDNQKTA